MYNMPATIWHLSAELQIGVGLTQDVLEMKSEKYNQSVSEFLCTWYQWHIPYILPFLIIIAS